MARIPAHRPVAQNVSSKKKCCEKFLHKSKVCKSCPLVADLSKRERKIWVKKRRRKAA